jgi:hypothetical protein
MNFLGTSRQLSMTLRLYFRNTMALVYGYAFPVIFLLAFWVLYRYDRVPLVRHMGELLTIAVLGGACFGLPTAMVADRERGVWRRYRLTPMSTASLVTSTVLARYVLLLSAGLVQLLLAVLVGMPWPQHPMDLLVAFSFVAFAFLGLGLVIAMLADNVPAVQALGQCIFLPMLIIGGIAVRLEALPEWAQHLSAFFPGRYAVDAIQAGVNGTGLSAVGFSLFALALIGAAGCLAAAKMFRWDASQRFFRGEGKGWLAVALAAWVAVGVIAERRGGVVARTVTGSDESTIDLSQIVVAQPATTTPDATSSAAASGTPEPAGSSSTPSTTASPLESERVSGGGARVTELSRGARAASLPGGMPETTSRSPSDSRAASTAPPSAAAGATRPGGPEAPPRSAEPSPPASPSTASSSGSAPPPDAPAAIGPPRWQDVTLATIEHDILFDRLPPDSGVVTPIAATLEEPSPDLYDQLDTLAAALPTWAPGLVSDPVQRTRNLLYVAAVIDVFQMPTEAYVPSLIYARLEEVVPRETLIKVLYWIAVHPDAGDHSAMDSLEPLGIGPPNDIGEARARAAVYAVKLLGRLTGKRPAR